MGKDKTYWFGILPHVYYVKKGVRILLYNTQNGSSWNYRIDTMSIATFHHCNIRSREQREKHLQAARTYAQQS